MQVPTWEYTHWGQNECGEAGWEKVDDVVNGELVAGDTGWKLVVISGIVSSGVPLHMVVTGSAKTYAVTPFIPFS